MTTISLKPMSNTVSRARRRPRQRDASLASVLVLARLALDGGAGDLLRRWCIRRLGCVGFVLAGLHAFLEALHRAAQVLADVAQLLGAEDEDHHQQDDQPVPNAQSTHVASPRINCAAAS